MPLPKPNNKEKKSEFVSRCISELTDKKEFETQDQRIAVCYRQFDQAKAEADVVAGEGDNEFVYSAQKTYMGKKRSELDDSDFLFPETRSFPIVSPQDVRDAINNYGRMGGNISYDAFIKKLYNKAKNKGKEFVDAIPESTMEKYNLKASEDEIEYKCSECGYEGEKAEKCPKCGSSKYKSYKEEDDEDNGETEDIDEAEAQEGSKKLNKPFRTPGGPKKFSVYVKNDKGNIVKVNFGDPNMEIKRDDPERRKNYRARHNCDNPGPKWKANYWSCKMWSAKPVSKIAGSEDENETVEYEFEEYKDEFREMIVGSISSIKQHCENVLNNLQNESVMENLAEPFLQQQIAIAEDYVITMHNYVMFNQIEEQDMEAEAAKKGLWENIRRKKQRMGKNYKPAKPGSPDRPSKEAWEKAQ